MYVPSQLHDCECDSCFEEGCGLDLTGASNDVHVLNLNRVKNRTRKEGRIADCAILWKNRAVFAIVELKGGRTVGDIGKVTEQIQQGIDIMYQYLKVEEVNDVYPILMYKGRDPRPALRNQRVRFRANNRRIIPLKCGSRLIDAPFSF